MDNERLKITVEANGKTMIIDALYGGTAEEIAETFRSIMYWLTFVEGTINDVICPREELESKKDARVEELMARIDAKEDINTFLDDEFGNGEINEKDYYEDDDDFICPQGQDPDFRSDRMEE